MNIQNVITKDEFLDKKRDYSPFLVHLTKDDLYSIPDGGNEVMPARDVLDTILSQQKLKAFNHFFPYSPNLKSQNTPVIEKFNVVCFTETPIHQMSVLLDKTIKKKFNPEPYGLVFTKGYIREKGGNPVFYVTKKLAHPLWQYLYQPYIVGREQVPDDICKLLALITLCEDGNDWHWEREWRFVGDFVFELNKVHCGLCPENEISYFESKYSPVKFISPTWDFYKILAKLVSK